MQGAEPVRLVAHLERRNEEERTRVSGMLHHDVAGMLAAARMDLSRLTARVAQDAELADQLRRVDQLLEQVIRDARREMQRLHPALIDHFGLPMALRHLIEETCRSQGVQYTMDFAESVEGLEPPVPIAVYRVVELLLGQPGELREFEATLTARRDHYLLELRCQPTSPEQPPLLPAGTDRDLELLALRTWLESLGVAWQQPLGDTPCEVQLRLPRRVADDLMARPVTSEAPGA
jgi:hypothetical protein